MAGLAHFLSLRRVELEYFERPKTEVFEKGLADLPEIHAVSLFNCNFVLSKAFLESGWVRNLTDLQIGFLNDSSLFFDNGAIASMSSLTSLNLV